MQDKFHPTLPNKTVPCLVFMLLGCVWIDGLGGEVRGWFTFLF